MSAPDPFTVNVPLDWLKLPAAETDPTSWLDQPEPVTHVFELLQICPDEHVPQLSVPPQPSPIAPQFFP